MKARARKKDARPTVDAFRLSANPGGERLHLDGQGFDELVVGEWLHLERMDTRHWWLGVGDDSFSIYIDRDGRPRVVDQYRAAVTGRSQSEKGAKRA